LTGLEMDVVSHDVKRFFGLLFNASILDRG